MPEVSSINPFVAALHAGLSPIPVDTTSKRPLVAWKGMQEHPADHDECASWFAQGLNIGVVCGAVSNRLVCIDIEGVFRDRLPELGQRLRTAELFDLFEGWIAGYAESTPSGGLHVLIRVSGEGRVDGNTKLASSSDGHTWIETRGEGGYVIIAPSRNGSAGWELVSGGLDHIAWATDDEWSAVAAVLASFDEAPPPLTVASTSSTPAILRLGDSWIDDALAQLPSVAELLSERGWVPARSADSFGQHWVRPDKDPRLGHSASISHEAGRLTVHSSNAGLPVGVSMDALDVILAFDLGRVPTQSERVERLRQLRPTDARSGAADQTAESQPAPSSLNLGDDFWNSRSALSHIRTAALARRLSPDAVWEAVKCFYAATIPWNHRLPSNGTLDYISIVVGMSGAGKSRAKSEASDLLSECRRDGVAFPMPPGSGEGMTEIFLDRSGESKYALRGVGFYADEGKWLLDVSRRVGNTTMQALKQLWSGELTGSVAATSDRHRWLAPRDVRATVLISATPDVASEFLRADLTDEGLPQRISWGWAHYPHPDDRPEHPGPLRVPTWRPTEQLYEIELSSSLSAMIDSQLLAQSRGEMPGDHEGHSTYARLKTAAILSHLDGRMTVTDEDWWLSCSDWETTRKIRSYLQASWNRHSVERNVAIGEARAHQKIAENDVYLERACISLATKIKLSTEPMTARQIKDHLRHFSKRHQVDFREVIHRLEGRGLIIGVQGGWCPP